MAAVIAVPFAQSIRLGAVPGFLLAGMAVGPSGLSLINNITEIGNLAEIGVILLLFVIGIELQPKRLWQMKRLVFGMGSLQVLLTSLLLGAAGYFFFALPLKAAVLAGPALALSSTAFVLQLLTEKKALISTYGRGSISVLLLQDLAVVPLLALIPLLSMPELGIGEDIGLALLKSLTILGIVVVVGRFFLHPLLHRIALSGNPEIFTASAVLIVLGTAYITELSGLSMAMGAFLAGLLISDSSYRHQVMSEVQPFRGLLLGLFFMSMGMSLNLGLLLKEPILSISVVSALMATKAAVLFAIAQWFGLKRENSLAVSLLLAQSGEFALVLFSLAHQTDLLPDVLFQQLLLIVLLSMLATPIFAHFAFRLAKSQKKQAKTADSPPGAPLVIAGFGRVGRRIGDILSLSGKPFVALDCDAMIVESARAKGYPVFYGDVRSTELLKAAGASHAMAIIVTLNDPSATKEVVLSLRKTLPDTKIFVRGRSMSECCEIKEVGASGVVSENIEASLELARMALESVGVDEKSMKIVLNNFRQKYLAQLSSTNKLDTEDN